MSTRSGTRGTPGGGPTLSEQSRIARQEATLSDLPGVIQKELSTKLVWSVYSTLHVGGYAHWTKLRRWADRVAEKVYERKLDFLDFKR